MQRRTVKMQHNDIGIEEFDIKSNAHVYRADWNIGVKPREGKRKRTHPSQGNFCRENTTTFPATEII